MSNHVIDPSYFDEAIAEFAFNYDWYHVSGQYVDSLGYQKNTFTHLTISGSLQPQRRSVRYNKEGNIESTPYSFYCKSTYRIDTGDFLHYNNNWLIVISVEPLDEYGVRTCTLESATPAQYRDLQEGIKALTGEIIP